MVNESVKKNWHNQISKTITSVDDLRFIFNQANIKKSAKFYKEIKEVIKAYPVLISPFVLKECLKSKAISRQFIPNKRELINCRGENDPLKEVAREPTKNLIHMYPDRVLLIATDMCFSSCRFCTRKRIKKAYKKITPKELEGACKYLKKNKQIRDVLISGGDPLILEDCELKIILKKLRGIKSVKIIRIGTRAPFSCPYRITDQLVKLLKKFGPIYINVHLNHPDEFTPETIRALKKLYISGIILGSQTVLLRDINNSSETIKKLLYKCIETGIRPYYLYQCDEILGTEHFWTDYQEIFSVAKDLIGNISGLAVPNFAFDCNGGLGKVRVIPEFCQHKDERSITLKTLKNKPYKYRNLDRRK